MPRRLVEMPAGPVPEERDFFDPAENVGMNEEDVDWGLDEGPK